MAIGHTGWSLGFARSRADWPRSGGAFFLPDRDSSLWEIREALSVVPLCGPVLTQHALNVGVLTLNALVIGRF